MVVTHILAILDSHALVAVIVLWAYLVRILPVLLVPALAGVQLGARGLQLVVLVLVVIVEARLFVLFLNG